MYPEPNKYTTMFLAFLTMLTALTISAVAIYYSVAGLVAIFAAAAIPIMIMGTTLEVAKLVTAVWLHRYWSQAAWWLKYYLALAVLVLMFITSMGIFGYLSKAHIEQTSAGEESVAQVERLITEIGRQEEIIVRAETKINALQTSGTGSDANIQSQIDKEQERIDLAFKRIEPAIAQQNVTIESARTNDSTRTKPYEDQLTSITAEILRLETSAKEYEATISTLSSDSSGVEPLLAQISGLEEEIIRVTNQLQSKEDGQVRAGQAIIGVTSDGLFGGNTRTALAKWVQGQRDRITQIQGEVAQVRKDATSTVDKERTRLAGVVKDIRTVQIPALKARELTMLDKINEVRQTESPVISTARDEIQRLRESAEAQVANSQTLIERLRGQLAQTDKTVEIDAAVDEQGDRIKTANAEIEILTEQKYELEGEYRQLEAEVGPIKYIAEFVYGEDADKNMLEKAVTWVIIIIIFVFDPLAVLLLIASQYTFDFARKNKGISNDRARMQKIVDNPGPKDPDEKIEVPKYEDIDQETIDKEFSGEAQLDAYIKEMEQEQRNEDKIAQSYMYAKPEEEVPVQKKSIEFSEGSSNTDIPDTANRMFYQEELDESPASYNKFTEEQLDELDNLPDWADAKQRWKDENPNETLKEAKKKYLHGIIDELPWQKYVISPGLTEDVIQTGYIQNQEQKENSLWKTIGDK
jgi:hypothetical protein